MKNNVYEMALASIFSAIILVLALVPQIGFVTILPGVSITLVHIPTLIGIFILPRRYAFLMGAMFGIGSWIASFLYGVSPFDLAFQYPWISVLPRILFAVAAFYIYKGLSQLETKVKHGDALVFGVVSLITLFAIYYGGQAISIMTGANAGLITPFALLIAGLFLSYYYYFIQKSAKKQVLLPSAIILSTVAHTILVLGTVYLFSPSVFIDTFGTSRTVLGWIYAIAMTNGLIEALVAVLVATPIITALNQLEKQR
ncbi:MAG: ECF transporter S component [Acholeplasmataceae bacterium]